MKWIYACCEIQLAHKWINKKWNFPLLPPTLILFPRITSVPTLVYHLRRPDIFKSMITTMGQVTDARPWPHQRKNTHSSPYLWFWAVKHSMSLLMLTRLMPNALCVSLLFHSGRTGNLHYLMPLPTSDKDEWFAVFILISGHFSQPVGGGPFPSTALHVRIRGASASSGLLLVNQVCAIQCKEQDFPERMQAHSARSALNSWFIVTSWKQVQNLGL